MNGTVWCKVMMNRSSYKNSNSKPTANATTKPYLIDMWLKPILYMDYSRSRKQYHAIDQYRSTGTTSVVESTMVESDTVDDKLG